MLQHRLFNLTPNMLKAIQNAAIMMVSLPHE